MNQLTRNISSLDVAEMVDREHRSVIRDIRNIIEHMGGEHKIVQSYFIESTYTNSQNKTLPCFLLTKKGCELFGTRMNGEKGTQFAVKYIERFNEIEQHIEKQLPQDHITLALESALETRKQVQGIHTAVVEVKETVQVLFDTMRIDGRQEYALKSQGKAKVLEVLGGYDSPAYNAMSKKVFAKMWGDFKRHFILPRSTELPKARFEEGVRFISIWRPDTSMAIEIDSYNNQKLLKLVK
ncbi:Rha family transcriptional regulator [Lysinibacillus sp. NPDC086135]|uniref:Rha family transcriptional regulator n=1 Tax=Lysinibacillus sp. NPDC086135 TaxID=3364130 RepID=UPI0038072E68